MIALNIIHRLAQACNVVLMILKQAVMRSRERSRIRGPGLCVHFPAKLLLIWSVMVLLIRLIHSERSGRAGSLQTIRREGTACPCARNAATRQSHSVEVEVNGTSTDHRVGYCPPVQCSFGALLYQRVLADRRDAVGPGQEEPGPPVLGVDRSVLLVIVRSTSPMLGGALGTSTGMSHRESTCPLLPQSMSASSTIVNALDSACQQSYA